MTTPSNRRIGQPLLSIASTAELLAVSQKTVRRKIMSGEIIASKCGAQWRIRLEDVEAYLVNNRNYLSICVQ